MLAWRPFERGDCRNLSDLLLLTGPSRQTVHGRSNELSTDHEMQWAVEWSVLTSGHLVLQRRLITDDQRLLIPLLGFQSTATMAIIVFVTF